MLRLASRFRAFHRAGLTGILAWPEHHHAAGTEASTCRPARCTTRSCCFVETGSHSNHDGAVPVTPITTGGLSTVQTIVAPASGLVDSQDRLVVSTRESAMKTVNVRRDPRAWLCVLNDRFFGHWAQITGDVEVLSLPGAMEPLVEYYRSISGEHPDWDDYRGP
jgi:Pyridoxamine 5'-phosphate oxidase